jgi:hypothetical protein
MKARVLCLFGALIVALAGVANAGSGIKDGTLSAYSNGNAIVIRWVSEDEKDVRGFSVERRAGANGSFVMLTTPHIPAKGNGSPYEFIDNSAFRTTDNIYQYRITAVGNGSVYHVTVSHHVSSVKRTWGSIKAMFR